MAREERRRPVAAPLNTVFHLADESTPTPEEKLRALVGDDRSLFNHGSLGLAAHRASKGRFSRMLGRVGEMARSLSPFSEAGAAAANSGVGRAVGVCGAGVVALVCVGAASVVAPGLRSRGGVVVSKRAVLGATVGADDAGWDHRLAGGRGIGCPVGGRGQPEGALEAGRERADPLQPDREADLRRRCCRCCAAAPQRAPGAWSAGRRGGRPRMRDGTRG